MTAEQAKAIGLHAAISASKHARTLQALMEMRRLLNDIRPGGNLCNERIISDRLERIHDGLAKEFGMEAWYKMWQDYNEGKRERPHFD